MQAGRSADGQKCAGISAGQGRWAELLTSNRDVRQRLKTNTWIQPGSVVNGFLDGVISRALKEFEKIHNILIFL